MFAKMPNFVGQARLYYPFKENKIKKHKAQPANSKQDYERFFYKSYLDSYETFSFINQMSSFLKFFTSGKMQFKHRHCNA